MKRMTPVCVVRRTSWRRLATGVSFSSVAETWTSLPEAVRSVMAGADSRGEGGAAGVEAALWVGDGGMGADERPCWNRGSAVLLLRIIGHRHQGAAFIAMADAAPETLVDLQLGAAALAVVESCGQYIPQGSVSHPHLRSGGRRRAGKGVRWG